MRWSFAAPRIGTPQIFSGGKYQCGPVPRSAVKPNGNCVYDVNDFHAAGSAPVHYFSVNGAITNHVKTVLNSLGDSIYTKLADTNKWLSLKEFYR